MGLREILGKVLGLFHSKLFLIILASVMFVVGTTLIFLPYSFDKLLVKKSLTTSKPYTGSSVPYQQVSERAYVPAGSSYVAPSAPPAPIKKEILPVEPNDLRRIASQGRRSGDSGSSGGGDTSGDSGGEPAESVPVECSDDNPCADGQSCSDGQCIAVDDEGDEVICDDETPCEEGFSCTEGQCVAVEPSVDGAEIPQECTIQGINELAHSCEENNAVVLCKVGNAANHEHLEFGCFSPEILNDVECGTVFKNYYGTNIDATNDAEFVPGLLEALSDVPEAGRCLSLIDEEDLLPPVRLSEGQACGVLNEQGEPEIYADLCQEGLQCVEEADAEENRIWGCRNPSCLDDSSCEEGFVCSQPGEDGKRVCVEGEVHAEEREVVTISSNEFTLEDSLTCRYSGDVTKIKVKWIKDGDVENALERELDEGFKEHQLSSQTLKSWVANGVINSIKCEIYDLEDNLLGEAQSRKEAEVGGEGKKGIGEECSLDEDCEANKCYTSYTNRKFCIGDLFGGLNGPCVYNEDCEAGKGLMCVNEVCKVQSLEEICLTKLIELSEKFKAGEEVFDDFSNFLNACENLEVPIIQNCLDVWGSAVESCSDGHTINCVKEFIVNSDMKDECALIDNSKPAKVSGSEEVIEKITFDLINDGIADINLNIQSLNERFGNKNEFKQIKDLLGEIRISLGGLQCVENLQCSSNICDNNICIVKGELNAPCKDNGSCEGILECEETICKLPAGGGCNSSDECGEGEVCRIAEEGQRAFCFEKARPGAYCENNNDCTSETCTEAKRCLGVIFGVACVDDSNCDVGLKCSARVEGQNLCLKNIGSDCITNDECVADSTCRPDPSNLERNMCTPIAELGLSCDDNVDCIEGLICGEDRKCARPVALHTKENGIGCSVDDECVEGLICKKDIAEGVTKFCRAPVQAGYCDNDNQCANENCDEETHSCAVEEQIQVPVIIGGARCGEGVVGECIEGTTCRRTNIDGTYGCLPKANDGFYCDKVEDCVTNVCGENGLCGGVGLEENVVCAGDNQCVAGLVCRRWNDQQDNFCMQPADENVYCDDNTDCLSGSCVTNVCNVASAVVIAAGESQNIGELTDVGTEVELNGGSTATFTVDGESHSLVLDNLVDNAAEFTVTSKPQRSKIFLKVPKEIDLDGDGANDVVIQIRKIKNGTSPVIHIRKINKPEGFSTLNVGDVCTENYECKSKYCLDPEDDKTFNCFNGLAEGYACEVDGEKPCAEELVCKRGAVGQDTYCRKPSVNSAFCEKDEECIAGNTCVANTCAGPEGERCFIDKGCLSGRCSNRICVAADAELRAALDGVCVNHADCVSNVCAWGKCAEKLPLGFDCVVNSDQQCADGLVCRKRAVEDPLALCSEKASLTNYCESNEVCESGKCFNKACVSVVQDEGKACVSIRDCPVGLFCQARTCQLVSCTDSDAGEDLVNKGTLTLVGSVTGEEKKEDRCIVLNGIANRVAEGICNINGLGGTTRIKSCPIGQFCVDGACGIILEADALCGEGIEGKCNTGLECRAGICKEKLKLEGQACQADNQCVAGLKCKDNICSQVVRLGAGERCETNDECQEDLSCITSECTHAGGEDENCKPDGSCNEGLQCDVNTGGCVRPAVIPSEDCVNLIDDDLDGDISCDDTDCANNNMCVWKINFCRGECKVQKISQLMSDPENGLGKIVRDLQDNNLQGYDEMNAALSDIFNLMGAIASGNYAPELKRVQEPVVQPEAGISAGDLGGVCNAEGSCNGNNLVCDNNICKVRTQWTGCAPNSVADDNNCLGINDKCMVFFPGHNGFCIPTCNQATDCAGYVGGQSEFGVVPPLACAGMIGHEGLYCQPEILNGQACQENAVCQSRLCVNNACQACVTNDECGAGNVCDNGICTAEVEEPVVPVEVPLECTTNGIIAAAAECESSNEIIACKLGNTLNYAGGDSRELGCYKAAILNEVDCGNVFLTIWNEIQDAPAEGRDSDMKDNVVGLRLSNALTQAGLNTTHCLDLIGVEEPVIPQQSDCIEGVNGYSLSDVADADNNGEEDFLVGWGTQVKTINKNGEQTGIKEGVYKSKFMNLDNQGNLEIANLHDVGGQHLLRVIDLEGQVKLSDRRFTISDFYVGDLDNNGFEDLYYDYRNPNDGEGYYKLEFQMNDGGNFLPTTLQSMIRLSIESGVYIYDKPQAGDFDGDGDKDLIFWKDSLPDVLISQEGTFSLDRISNIPQEIKSVISRSYLLFLDINNDGSDEILSINEDGSVSALFGKVEGEFGLQELLPAGTVPFDTSYAPLVADVNGDGNKDVTIGKIARGIGTGAAITALINNGDGTFIYRNNIFGPNNLDVGSFAIYNSKIYAFSFTGENQGKICNLQFSE